MADKFSTNLQESITTLLCVDNEYGQIASGILDVELLEPPFDDIARRAIDYRRRYGEAPGAAHIDDLFDHILSDQDHKKHKLYSSVLGGVLDQAEGLNAPYILSRVNEFMRSQNLKAAVIEAGQRYQQGGNNLITDVETILHGALKYQTAPLEVGTYLGDRKSIIGFLNNQTTASYKLNLPELDRRQIGPTFGELLGFMAPKGRGKTWFCIHTGIACLMQGARVVHVSLEMGNARIMPRYLQHMFAIAKRPGKIKIPEFKFDELERVSAFSLKEIKPELNFMDARIDHKIGQRMGEFGNRLNRLIVKTFPSGSLTIEALEAYLDALELTEKFTPTVLIVDYPDLMSIPGSDDNFRHALGKLYIQLRGLCARRNLAGIVPIQSNRQGETAKLVTAELTGEDYSKTQTLDMLLTYSQTKQEKALGLARIFVDKARNDEDKFTILIAQNYATGQFCTQSAFMPGDHWAMLKKASGQEDDEE